AVEPARVGPRAPHDLAEADGVRRTVGDPGDLHAHRIRRERPAEAIGRPGAAGADGAGQEGVGVGAGVALIVGVRRIDRHAPGDHADPVRVGGAEERLDLGGLDGGIYWVERDVVPTAWAGVASAVVEVIGVVGDLLLRLAV